MVLHKVDKECKFKSIFNTQTGFYMRTGIIDDNGKDTGVDPFMASFPELIDIGIMGHCIHGLTGKCKESGVQCYQHGDIQRAKHMAFDDYKSIIDECKGKTFQVALGGCGDPDKHPDFGEMLRYARDKNIVPNYTTSGFGLTDEGIKLSKRYCGAVAVSWYRSRYTIDSIEKLVSVGVTTNIHYVLGNNSIDEAIKLLRDSVSGESGVSGVSGVSGAGFPTGINAVIFLLHKPIGLGSKGNVLSGDDKRVGEFFNLIDNYTYPFKVGFDSCTVPGIIRYMRSVDYASVETCEAARWSMYITPDMKGLPCSFDNQSQNYAVDIKAVGSIQAVWESNQFNQIRDKFHSACSGCNNRELCLGGCPLMDGIKLCGDR